MHFPAVEFEVNIHVRSLHLLIGIVNLMVVRKNSKRQLQVILKFGSLAWKGAPNAPAEINLYPNFTKEMKHVWNRWRVTETSK